MFRKLISVLTSFILIFQSISPFFIFAAPAYAQDTSTQSAIESSPEPSVSPSPSVTVEPVVTPTPSPDSSPTPTPTVEPSPSLSPSPTPVPSTEVIPSPSPTPNQSPNPPPSDVELVAIVAENTDADSVESLDLDPQESTSAQLVTDKADYAPTDTAVITGTGLTPNTTYIIVVSSTDDPATSTTENVTTDGSGSFVYAYQLDGIYRPNYSVVLKDQAGNVVATTTFTDAPPPASSVNIEQCANGQLAGPFNICKKLSGSDGYVTGNVNSSKAHWKEGEFLPYRALLETPFAGAQQVQFSFDTAKSSELKHAIDYLSSYDLTETTLAANSEHANQHNPCADFISGCSPSGPFANGTAATEVDIPVPVGLTSSYPSSCANGSFTGPATTGKLRAWVSTGTISNLAVAIGDPSTSGDCPSIMTVTFDLSNANAKVVLAWSGHVSANNNPGSGGYWGPGTAIPTGSPYHLHAGFPQLSGGQSFNVGNQDLQLASSAIIQTGSITIIKDTVPNDTQDFSFTTTGSGLSSFSLDDDGETANLSNTKVFSSVVAGSYTVVEGAQVGFDLTGLVCTDPTSNTTVNLGTRTASINLAAGESVTCTYTNTKRGTIVVEKQTSPDGTAGNFTFTGDAAGTISDNGQITVGNLVPGTYTSTETSPSPTFALSNISCDDGQSTTPSTFNTGTRTATFELDPGETIKCTFTNTLQQGHLIVNKVTVPSSDTTTEFSITASGTGTITGNATRTITGGSSQDYTVTAGTYSVSEEDKQGWVETGNTCNDVNVPAGGQAECTITNTQIACYPDFTKTFRITGAGKTQFTHNKFTSGDWKMVLLYSVDGAAQGPVDFVLTNPGAPGLADLVFEKSVDIAVPNTLDWSVTLDSWEFQVRDSGTNDLVFSSGNVLLSPEEITPQVVGESCTKLNTTVSPVSVGTLLKLHDIEGDGVVSEFDLGLGGWDITITDEASNSATVTTVGDGFGGGSVAFDFDLGTYIVSEVQKEGWTQSYPNNGDAAFTCESDVSTNTCTANNDGSWTVVISDPSKPITLGFGNYQTPKLTLIKEVVNNNGGTALATDWTLSASGPTPISGVTGNAAVTSALVDPGTYNLSESGPAGYTASDWVCVGKTQDDGDTVTLGAGDDVTCTITNNDIAPTLKLVKIVDNGNGGNAVSGDWTLTATGSGGFSDTGDSVTFHPVTAGVGYVLSESAVNGYDAGSWSCDGGSLIGDTVTLGLDEDVTCTITNDDVAPTITLIKVVNNNFNGSAGVNDFGLTVGGVSVNSGQVATVLANTPYEINEIVLPGYEFVSITGAGCPQALGGSVTLNEGESVTCTITNKDLPGHLIVHKVTNPTDTTNEFSITATGGTVEGEATQNIVGGGTVDYTVHAGTYDVTEATEAGWDETGNTCNDVVVANGETKECTITNTQRGHIVIVKDVIGNPDPTDFTFHNNFGNGNPDTFLLDEDNNGDLPSSRDFEVLPGEYEISEEAVLGWQSPESTSCTNGETINSIDVAPGETVTCTFVNEELVTITLVKNTIGGNDDFNFIMTGDGLPLGDQISTVDNTGSKVYAGLDQDDTFTISEVSIPAGWALTSATCTGGETPGNISPEIGEDVTCTFVNNKPAAQIDVTPLSATNKIGEDHVITANVQVHNGDGNWGSAADGTLVTFSLLNNNASANFVGSNTCLTSGGSCSITINSTSTGSVDIHAEATPQILGVNVNVATGTGGENSANAGKTYVDARILIAQDGTNEVDDPHTFTVTVEEDTGSGWTGVFGLNPVVTFSPSNPGTVNDDCASIGTDFDGKCTVEVNSAVAGVFTASANVNFQVSGVDFNISTDNTGENSGTATKTYVDASIVLSPQEATNNITDPHEIIAYVTKDEGTGPVNAAGVTVTFSNTGSATFVGNDNDCVTVADGTCSVSINSSTPGNNVIDATTTFSVGGVSLTRATNGNAGPDGTDAAEKEYVAGSLEVTKVVEGLNDIVNASSIDEDFTVTVTGPSYPSGHEIVFSLVDGVLQAPTSVTLDPIIPGDYTITESDAGSEWTETVPANAVTVVANQTASGTVTNTYVPGSLELEKVVELNGYLIPEGVDLDFTINVTGPSYPAPEAVVINVVDGIPSNSPQTLENLIPGEYSVTETNPGIAWTVSGEGSVTVNPAEIGNKTITNSLKIPSTEINITPNTFETEPGQNVILTITDTNNGEVPISNPSVELLANNVLTNPQPTYVSGDTNTNNIQDIGETWTWTVSLLISVETQFTVNGIGTDPLGNPVNGPTYQSETDSVTVKVIGTTRTLGFWQTHTTFTTYILDNMFGVNGLQIGNHTTHKAGTGTVNGGLTDNELFGGFYAPIAKTTAGAKRNPIDQARIQMLQQLLAAKLNCAAFGCSSAIQTLITQSDAAYALGANKNTIISLAGQLDAFNNSGDANAIPAGLPATGKATPKTSQDLADKAFWNAP